MQKTLFKCVICNVEKLQLFDVNYQRLILTIAFTFLTKFDCLLRLINRQTLRHYEQQIYLCVING